MLSSQPRGTTPLITLGQGSVVLPFLLSYSQPCIIQKIILQPGVATTITKTVLHIQPQRSLTKAWLTLKRKKNNSDAQALIQKVITTSPSAGVGQILDDGFADGIGSIAFTISSAENAVVSQTRVVFYEIQLGFDTGEIASFEAGNLTVARVSSLSKLVTPYTVQGWSAGEKFDFNRTVLLAAGRTLSYAWLRIKREKEESNADSLVQKLITTNPSLNVGVISDNGGVSQTAQLTFQLTEGDSTKINPHRVVWYEITTQLDDGTATIWQSGILTLTQRVTNALS